MEDITARALNPHGSLHLLIKNLSLAPLCFARWTDQYKHHPGLVATAFARVIGIFPLADVFAKQCLQDLQPLAVVINAPETPLEQVIELLVALLRLLRHDPRVFLPLLPIQSLWPCTRHGDKRIALLAIYIVAFYTEASDFEQSEQIKNQIGDESVFAVLEDGLTYDLHIFGAWEDKRFSMARKLLEARQAETLIQEVDLSHPRIANLAGVLVPRLPHTHVSSNLVLTDTATLNLRDFAHALNASNNILLQGPKGSGKTLLVEDVAAQLGCAGNLVRVHLGEQTDAKLLLGTYVTGATPGQFTWQAGLLTNAVKQGKWLLVEDIDRAPKEVLSVLLPLMETGRILIPSRDEVVVAAPGFRLLATRTVASETKRTSQRMLGSRLWHEVQVRGLPIEEVRQVIVARFPVLAAMADTLLRVWHVVANTQHAQPSLRSSRQRTLGVQDLLKWARRIVVVFTANGIQSPSDTMTTNVVDDIFSEAVDCFAATASDLAVFRATVADIGVALEYPPERVQLYLDAHIPAMDESKRAFSVGRAMLPKKSSGTSKATRGRPFAYTGNAARLMEQLMVACKLKEPLLLVGETGTGKTTVVQQLANTLGHKLVAINMSQQTESGDLLGGFKPVDTKSLAVPLIETFEHLFEKTLSASKNAKFLAQIRRAFAKGQWRRFAILLREACKIAVKKLDRASPPPPSDNDDAARKRRKLNSPLLAEWQAFDSLLDSFDSTQEGVQKAFSFSFVEGTLIRAMRNGDWVLLDEINLSSPDTLESINGLLQEVPSIVLTEKGDLEPIVAHPDFRVFACMNPATDVGKKDLPAGVRARFTELYVHSPDSNLQDLLAIIAKYIGGFTLEDSKACEDVAQLYMQAKSLALQNRLVDGANQRPHYSIRTLSRTLSYVADICPIYGLRRSLYEGFCMSYLTLLDLESEALLLPIIEQYTIARVRNAKSLLFQTPKQPAGDDWIQFRHYWLHRGPLEPDEDTRYILTPFVEKNLLNLVRAAATRKFPILLQGPTSSGKTSLVEYLAKRTGHQFVRINNHEHTDLQEYLGGYTSDAHGALVFQEGLLVQAVRQGHWLVLDELNLAPTDVLEALNRLLDDNRELLIPETQEVIKPHPNFMLFATQNPPGLYGGRKHLSRAFRNRFLELHVDDIPQGELETILCQRCQVAPSYCKKIVEVYRQLSLRRQSSRVFEQKSSFATLRDLFRWAMRPAVGYEELATNGYYLLAERVRRPEEKELVKEVIETVIKVKLDNVEAYEVTDLAEFQELADLPEALGKIVWTKAMRRLFKLLTLAFRNKEPVLLVGETGCGKTTVCQMVAHALKQPIQMLNAHQNTETADLIGALRPIRSKSQTMAALEQDLLGFLDDAAITAPGNASLEQLISTFGTLDVSNLDSSDALADRATGLRESIDRLGAIFAWADGPLVQAMTNGEVFLLDEISLAEDSVLERLNSVLETKRTLVLAEKGTAGETTVKTHEQFQFCATMNPGGDFGKKELSPALRNRFTEIWIPAVSAQDDIVQIVRGALLESRQHLCLPMVNFAEWFQSAFQGPLTSSAVSIRDLLAWSALCNHEKLSDAEAFVNGAALVYIDALGASASSGLLSEAEQLQAKRQTCLARLSQIVGFDCQSLYDRNYEFEQNDTHVAIGPFALSCGPLEVEADSFQFGAATTHLNATRVLRASQLRKPILLEGSPGVGKTSLISAIATAARRHLVRINLSEQTDLMDLFGSDTPVEGSTSIEFSWRDAPFLQAMQSGSWVLLDEMNLASQAVLEGLNACLDYRAEAYVPELGRSFKCHPDFRVFAAQNPHKQGGGRKGLPKSFVNRFTVVYCDPLLSTDLTAICKKLYPTRQEAITKVVAFMTDIDHRLSSSAFGRLGQPWEFNLRDMLRWLSVSAANPNESIHHFAHVIVRQRFRCEADRTVVDELMASHFGPEALQIAAQVRLTSTTLAIGAALTNRAIHGSGSTQDGFPGFRGQHGQALESILHCVNQAWPCILIGSSGVGKSMLVQAVAQVLGHKLSCLTMTSDMDSSDLLGSYEQRDTTRSANMVCQQAEQHMLQYLRSEPLGQSQLAIEALQQSASGSKSPTDRLSILMSALQRLNLAPELRSVMDNLLQEIGDGSTGHFQWADGSLVRAVRDGSWLLLDNANLCSPSVLDRLNSLLEFNGVLTVNERVLADGQPMVIVPHKNFRLFLTADPMHGELSRAMRNRGIEIHLDLPTHPLPFLTSLSALDSHWTAIGRSIADCAPQMTVEFGSVDVAELIARSTDGGLQTTQQIAATAEEHRIEQAFAAIRKVGQGQASVRHLLYTQAALALGWQQLDHSNQLWDSLPANTLLPTEAMRLPYFQLLREVSGQLLSANLDSDMQLSDGVALERCLQLLSFLIYRSGLGPLRFDDAVGFLHRITEAASPSALLAEVTGPFLRAVNSLALFRPLSRGQYLSVFWQSLRPNLPTSLAAAQVSLALRELGRSIDATTWAAAGATDEVITMQRNYLQLLQSTCRINGLQLDERPLILPAEQLFDPTSKLDEQTIAVFQSLSAIILLGSLADFDAWQQNEMPYFQDYSRVRALAHLPCSALLHFVRPMEVFQRGPYARKSALTIVILQEWLQLALGSQNSVIREFSGSMARTGGVALGALIDTVSATRMAARQLCRYATVILDDELTVKAKILLIRLKDYLEILDPSLVQHSVFQAAWRDLSTRQQQEVVAEQLQRLCRHVDSTVLQSWHNALVCTLITLDTAVTRNFRSKSLGQAFVYLATGFVCLYVPELPTDPAEPLMFERNFLHFTSSKIAETFLCQRIINAHLTGVPDSQQTQLLAANQAELAAKAASSQEPLPLRPEVSQMANVASELSYFVSLLLDSGDISRACAALANDAPSQSRQSVAQAGSLLQTLAKLQTRLESFSDYLDMLSPVVDSLVQVRVGLTVLCQAVVETAAPKSPVPAPTAQTIVIQNLQAAAVKELLAITDEQQPVLTKQLALALLSVVGYRLKNGLLAKAKPGLVMQLVSSVTAHLFQKWYLARDEALKTAQESASLYKHQDVFNEDKEDAYKELFPDYDDSSRVQPLAETKELDRDIFDAHRAILQALHAKTDQSEFSLTFALEAVSDVYMASHSGSAPRTASEDEGPALTGAIYYAKQLCDKLSSENVQSKVSRIYDFYRSENPVETQAVVPLLMRLKARILELVTAWPENATLVDLAESVSRLLSLPQAVPVAQMLTMFEQVFTSMAQWQEVASREFSIATLLEEVRSTIVKWRQYELRAWPHLFQLEEASVRRADSQVWYNLYELIILVPSKQTSLDERFVVETISAIVDFLSKASVGQIGGRLDDLSAFALHLQWISNGRESLLTFANAIRNVSGYFGAYRTKVNEFIAQERKILAKEVSDIIKLASWKDTNVYAMRESSRRSHRQLYKLIHKYRRILNAPAEPILRKGLSMDGTKVTQAIGMEIQQFALVNVHPQNRPKRFVNSQRTARRVESIVSKTRPGSNALVGFIDGALQQMEALRKETPTSYKKEEESMVKHLKTRKRKLLSDSLKELRQLGLRSTLKPEQLLEQKSQEAIFLNSCTLDKDMQNNLDHYLNSILDILPEIRSCYANHAEDITSPEIKRAVGFFDFLLFHVLQHRMTLQSYQKRRRELSDLTSAIYELAYKIQGNREFSRPETFGSSTQLTLSSCLESSRRIQQVMHFVSKTYDAHCSFAPDITPVSQQVWWQDNLNGFSNLRSRLEHAESFKFIDDAASSTMEDFMKLREASRVQVLDFQHQEPSTAHLLEPLLSVLKTNDALLSEQTKDGTYPAAALEIMFQSTSDAMLAAVQNVVKVSLTEGAEWFVMYDSRQTRSLAALSLKSISSRLATLVDYIKDCCAAIGMTDEQIVQIRSVCTNYGPIFSAFDGICQLFEARFTQYAESIARCALLTGRTTNTLAQNGFCSPQEADPQPGESKETTDGTGLADGQGNEDITKDLEDDEDLGDMDDAGSPQKQDQTDDTEAKELDDDIAGDLESVAADSADDQSDEDAEDDIDNEVGDVDDADPSAVDEKMWDGEEDNSKESKESRQDETARDDQGEVDLVDKHGDEQPNKPQDPQEEPSQPENNVDELEEEEDAVDEGEADDVHDDNNDVDQDHLPEAQNLDLPENLGLDEESDLNASDDEHQSIDHGEMDLDEGEDDAFPEDGMSVADVDDMEAEQAESGQQPDEAPAENDQDDDEARSPVAEDETEAAEEKTDGLDGGAGAEEHGSDKQHAVDSATDAPNDADDAMLDRPEEDAHDSLKPDDSANHGDEESGNRHNEADSSMNPQADAASEQVHSLGNRLEEFRRMLQIADAQHDVEDASEQQPPPPEATGDERELQHVNAEEQSSGQALGPSTEEQDQIHADADAPVPEMEDGTLQPDEELAQQDEKTEDVPDKNDPSGQEAASSRDRQEAVQDLTARARRSQDAFSDLSDSEGTPDVEMTEAPTELAQVPAAGALWQRHEQSTRDLANGLCEQLRLILEPTLATRLRGDFRTGKRLNMRRIIPYIASQFKKDKIWLRRNKPSKRQYQVMLSIDDSKSMAESDSVSLAFDTVALVATALSVLEVGSIAVVKFGAQPEVVHDFKDAFSSEAGANVFGSFSFDQGKTNVKALAAQSLEMFVAARAMQAGAAEDLWQLQFIISDGICEDHESIRRILRQAHEEHIMVVFVVLDTIHGNKRSSIMKMNEVKNITQPDGSKSLKIQSYMEGFASIFENFLIIQDVSELPEMLCSTLRQFFAGVTNA